MQDATFVLMESKVWPIEMPLNNLLINGASWIKENPPEWKPGLENGPILVGTYVPVLTTTT